MPGASSAADSAGWATSSIAVADRPGSAVKPTIVFVRGAFADASGFAASIGYLQHAGYPVLAPANPLRGLVNDADSIRAFLSTIAGPIALVGHSHGVAVITNAATGNPNVTALVYIAAYALDKGENVNDANSLGGGHSDLLANVDFRPIPGVNPAPPPKGDLDAYIRLGSFRAIFAADVPNATAAVMAATQRPAAVRPWSHPPDHPPGAPSPPGTSSLARTMPSRPRPSASWRPVRTPRPSRSTAPTPLWSAPRAVTALILAAVRGTR